MNKSNNSSLKSALKTHYQKKRLPQDKLEQLLALQKVQMTQNNNSLESNCTLPQEQSWAVRLNERIGAYIGRKVSVYAFTLCALLVLVIILTPMPISGPAILAEIAGHHQESSKITVYSSSLSEIGDQLEKLSFTLIASSKLSSDIWQFIGGSYCSINGELAAQLKVRNREDNKVYTFYQAEYPSELTLNSLERLSATNTKGTQVSIWKEDGLLLGLAKTAH